MASQVAASPEMTSAADAARLRVRRLSLLVVAAVLGSVIFAAVVTAAAIALSGRPGWWSGWWAALAASLLAASAALGALVPGLRAGGDAAVYGFMIAAFLRVVVTLAGCAAAVFVWHTPPTPTLMLAMPLFFVQIVVELIVLRRAFWLGR